MKRESFGVRLLENIDVVMRWSAAGVLVMVAFIAGLLVMFLASMTPIGF